MKDEEQNSSKSAVAASQNIDNTRPATANSDSVNKNKETKKGTAVTKKITAVNHTKKPQKVIKATVLSNKQVVINVAREAKIKKRLTDLPEGYKPAIMHASFDTKHSVIDPERPLTDIPEPARRFSEQLSSLYDIDSTLEDADGFKQAAELYSNNTTNDTSRDSCWFKADAEVTKWDLIQSVALSEHLQLLQAGELAKFPSCFYNNSKNTKTHQPLLSSLTDMQLLEISEIQDILRRQPKLKRSGFENNKYRKTKPLRKNIEIQNSHFSDDWEVILYPQRFDNSNDLFYTDIMACSIVYHVLTQCSLRKTINTKISISDITNYIRSYQLSQCKQVPSMREQLRRTGIYDGHVILVALLIEQRQLEELKRIEKHTQSQVLPQPNVDLQDSGLHGKQCLMIQLTNKASRKEPSQKSNKKDAKYGTKNSDNTNEVYLNLSARSALFTRYPILSNYYINGWK